jgi:hypothetical protein
MQTGSSALQIQLLTGTIYQKQSRNFTNAGFNWQQANELLVQLLKHLRNA